MDKAMLRNFLEPGRNQTNKRCVLRETDTRWNQHVFLPPASFALTPVGVQPQSLAKFGRVGQGKARQGT